MTDKGNLNKLPEGLLVLEDAGTADHLPGKRPPSDTSVGGLRSKPRHRGLAVCPCRLGDPGVLYRGGLDAAALCC